MTTQKTHIFHIFTHEKEKKKRKEERRTKKIVE